MIRNIIFDMGNVLLDFDPEAAVRRLPVEPTAQQFIKELLFASPEWVAFDRGDRKSVKSHTRIISECVIICHDHK